MFEVIIPARLASARLPRKILLDYRGKPLLLHAYERALQSRATRVTLAVDDREVFDICKQRGANVVMTDPNCRTGSDRVAEAAEILGLSQDTIIVHVQADEPHVPVSYINIVGDLVAETEVSVLSTLASPISQVEELVSPSVVKVVCDKFGQALYFSRGPIPWSRDHLVWGGSPKQLDIAAYRRHMGLYGYRVAFIREYMNWEPSPYEDVECLEQLRVLWNGGKIRVGEVKEPAPQDVNTLEDYERLLSVVS